MDPSGRRSSPDSCRLSRGPASRRRRTTRASACYVAPHHGSPGAKQSVHTGTQVHICTCQDSTRRSRRRRRRRRLRLQYHGAQGTTDGAAMSRGRVGPEPGGDRYSLLRPVQDLASIWGPRAGAPTPGSGWTEVCLLVRVAGLVGVRHERKITVPQSQTWPLPTWVTATESHSVRITIIITCARAFAYLSLISPLAASFPILAQRVQGPGELKKACLLAVCLFVSHRSKSGVRRWMDGLS